MININESNIDYEKIIEILKNSKGKKLEVSKESFYHGTSIEYLPSIFTYGLLSKSERIKRNITPGWCSKFNGKYYISVTRKTDDMYTYNHYTKDKLSLVINPSIKAYKPIYCMNRGIHYFINRTSLPLRFTEWPGEYHIKYSIPLKDILAIQYNLSERLQKNSLEENTKLILEISNLISIMDEYAINLPLIDGVDNTEINKEVFREYLKSIK